MTEDFLGHDFVSNLGLKFLSLTTKLSCEVRSNFFAQDNRRIAQDFRVEEKSK